MLSQALAPHTKTLIGVDISPKSVAYFNERVANQGIPEDEMKAICVELTTRGTGETDVFGGIEFGVIVVSKPRYIGLSFHKHEYPQCTLAYHHFEDIAVVTKTLASYLKPGSGTLLVVDLIRTPVTESLHTAHGAQLSTTTVFETNRIFAGHVVAHKGGFLEETVRAAFVDTAGLQDFSFTKVFQMTQDDKSADLFIAKGVRSSA